MAPLMCPSKSHARIRHIAMCAMRNVVGLKAVGVGRQTCWFFVGEPRKGVRSFSVLRNCIKQETRLLLGQQKGSYHTT